MKENFKFKIGGLISLKVELGQYVNKGDVLAIIENIRGEVKNIRSPYSGYVIKVTRYPLL